MSNLDDYTNQIFNFEKNQDPASFEERSGPPEELPAVVGMIAMKFQDLDDVVTDRIIQMSHVDRAIGEILTAELSFKSKVDVFASLYFHQKDSYKFNTLPGFEDGYFKELIKALRKCEELRNKIMHSKIVDDWRSNSIVRSKTVARNKKGLIKTNEKVDIPYLYNISDYMVSMRMEIDELFLLYNE